MPKRVQLGKRMIQQDSKPYVIAEIGVNHEGSMQQAKILIEQAKTGGADAAKFQSYKAGTLASKHSPSYWDTTKEATRSQYELFQKYDGFGPLEYVELAEHCQKVGIDFISTPFDDQAVEFLDPLVPFFKVASADLTNTPFLRKIGAKQKPVVLSTGAATLGEVDEAVRELEKAGCPDVVLLHCILNYPTPNPQAHLRMIEGLSRTYPQHVIGYSDHTLPDESMIPLVSAWLLGAVVLEKHFTHDNDHYHAMNQQDLERFIEMVERIDVLMGDSSHKTPIETEAISRLNARRSIVLTRSVRAGHVLEDSDLTYKRPGTGISPLYWDTVVGSQVISPLEEDHVLHWENLSRGE